MSSRGIGRIRDNLAERTVVSTMWNFVANATTAAISFTRSVLLARLLPIEVFGVYALASAVVSLSRVVPIFGMSGALLHRAPETEDEDLAAAVHFTLETLFTLVWAVLLTIGAFVWADGHLRVALVVLTAIGAGRLLAHTPQVILVRRVAHRRLAIIQLLSQVLAMPVAVGLAWKGVSLWALLSVDLIGLMLSMALLYIWQPIWKPHLAWSPPVARYFLRFGSRNFVAYVLLQALDRVDDLWTGFRLGEVSLSFYSRAYKFATYPRLLLASPLNMVAGGVYAELKGDRPRLSRAFSSINAFLVRSGFFVAGLLALIAPEFIRLLLGARWLPALDAFRLMLVFASLDPIRTTVGHLFIAVGEPGQIARARFVQFASLVIGLVLLGPVLGISGVALAVDLMVIVGIGILLYRARAFVDFSLRGLFGPPAVGLLLSLGSAYSLCRWCGDLGSDWSVAGIKMGVFALVYVGTLSLLEGRFLVSLVRGYMRHLREIPFR